MDGVHLILAGQRDDLLDVQVRPDRFVRVADQIGFVRLEAVERVPVIMRVHRHRADTQFMARAEDTDRDLATIGDEELLDLIHEVGRWTI